MYDEQMFNQQTKFYLAIFRSMVPPEHACEEMRDAFEAAVICFYEEG